MAAVVKALNRLYECPVCSDAYRKWSSTQKTCQKLSCALELARLNREKKQRREDSQRKVEIRSKREWMKLAQTVANGYVRLRDAHHGCVSCDRPSTWQGQWHASHFKSVGAASAVRFNFWNIHKSCSICNNWKSGNLTDYEPRLRAKIGDVKVDWLKTQTQPRTYSVEYLQKFIKVFKKKIKRLTYFESQ